MDIRLQIIHRPVSAHTGRVADVLLPAHSGRARDKNRPPGVAVEASAWTPCCHSGNARN